MTIHTIECKVAFGHSALVLNHSEVNRPEARSDSVVMKQADHAASVPQVIGPPFTRPDASRPNIICPVSITVMIIRYFKRTQHLDGGTKDDDGGTQETRETEEGRCRF